MSAFHRLCKSRSLQDLSAPYHAGISVAQLTVDKRVRRARAAGGTKVQKHPGKSLGLNFGGNFCQTFGFVYSGVALQNIHWCFHWFLVFCVLWFHIQKMLRNSGFCQVTELPFGICFVFHDFQVSSKQVCVFFESWYYCCKTRSTRGQT